MTLATAALLKAGSTASRPDGDLTIVIGGKEIIGWQDVEVTLRAEGFPNSFAIGASAKHEITDVARPGARCQVYLGGDLVITGYLDRNVQGGGPVIHTLGLIGRGLTQDLVDCSAEWPSGQMINGDALSISQQIAQPYGIQVALAEGAAAGPKLPGWLLNYGETGASIVQSVARNARLMAYESAQGVLLLAKVGTGKAASGVRYGDNVQEWQVEQSADGRFSDYVCAYLPSNTAIDLTGPGDIFYHRETDPSVTRHRQLDFVLEAVASDTTPGEFTIARTQWEAAQRAGRSTVVSTTIDSWRDADGKLWTPNTLVPVDLPGFPAADLILGEVTFRRSNETGTTASLVLMPAQAFTPEPLVLQPVPADLI